MAIYPELISRNVETSKDVFNYDSSCKIISYGNITFQNPLTIYDETKNFLSSRIIEIPISSDYFYKPEYLSNYLYYTTSLWHMILKLNNCLNHKEFNKRIAKVLDPNKLNDLIELINLKKQELYNNKKKGLDITDLTLKDMIT